jgi:alpha-glucosidase
VLQNKPILVSPGLSELPVYVREGSILPIAPLTQNTEDVPQGPLILRVYPGENCHGELYQDDGTTFAFRTGQFLRMHFSCKENADGSLNVMIAAAEGDYTPWWKTLRVDVYGWQATRGEAHVAKKTLELEHSAAASSVELPITRDSVELTFE